MSRYKAYSSYKETRHSWLESVPAHWKMLPLKFLTAQHVTDGPHETPEFIDEGVPFLSVDGIQNNQLVFEGCRYISREDHARYSIKCKPNQGDVLLGKAASVGKVAHVDTDIEFNVWSPLAVIRPLSEKIGRFIYYSLQSALLQMQCDMYSNANTQKNLGMSIIDNLAFASPTDDEAEQVANFLDHETAKIDALIEKQQRLIELLKEKRQAVISHAVTKGLNPNAPMKDSGVEWTDRVPAHWRVSKLGYHASVSNGATPNRENMLFWENGTIGWLNSSKVNDEVIKEADQFITGLALSQTSVKPVKNGDLVMAITGEGQTRGRVAICNIEATINQHLAAISIRDKLLQHEFLYLWLEGNYERIRYESEGAGSTKGAITCSEISAFPVILPSLEEQGQIVSHVVERKQKFDGLIREAISAIELMRERRTALISAAVTGKIDLRDWQAVVVQKGVGVEC